MTGDDFSRFRDLTYEKFRALARNPALSPYEKIGFPDSYRAGQEDRIFADIRQKLANLDDGGGKTFLDIGPGASDLPRMLIDWCGERGHRVLLVDSPEMLALLPDASHVTKIPGRFPDDCMSHLSNLTARVDAALAYSVLQYVFTEGNIYRFFDELLRLIAPRGRALIGDIPNISKRKRFFSSDDGIRHHQEFTGTSEKPPVEFNVLEPGHIDDSVVLALVARCRNAGFDAYLVPQETLLPMSNRREDVLIVRP